MIFLLFISAIVFLIVSKSNNHVNSEVSAFTRDTMSPIVDVLSLPARAFVATYRYIIDIKNIHTENKLLKEENKQLYNAQLQLRALEIENSLLSQLLNYIPPPDSTSHTVRIVATENDAFANSFIAYTGNVDSIKKGQIALTHEGVIGRVDNVGSNYSTISLITDINSRIPVVIERNRTRGVLYGDNTNLTKLMFTPFSADIRIGDRVLTSGIAGVFPPGLPVGIVTSVDKNDIFVKPFANIKSAEYIKIIGYEEDVQD